MRTLYIVDVSNWIYKGISTYNVNRTINNITYNVGAPCAFIKAVKACPYKDIAFVLDGVPVASNYYLPGYKGQRLKEPDERFYFPKTELIQFISKLGNVFNKNVTVLCSAGQEADQVISSICWLISNQVDPGYVFCTNLSREEPSTDRALNKILDGYVYEDSFDFSKFTNAIVATTDSDMYQLCALGCVGIDSTMSGKSISYGEHTPEAVHHLPPAAIPAYKAIMGDVSDNVPPIGLSIKKTPLIKLLESSFLTKQDFDDFLVALNKAYTSPLTEEVQTNNENHQYLIHLILKEGKYKEFTRNYKVTRLEFYSTPYSISFPNYDINSTVVKYSLGSWINPVRQLK